MNLKQGTLGAVERRKDGNGKSRHSGGAPIQKRIMSAVAAVVLALLIATYCYHRSAHLRNNGDWRLFWTGEVFIGVWLVYAVVQILRNGIMKAPSILHVTSDHLPS